MENIELFTLPEVAKLLKVSRRQVYELIYTDRLKAGKVGGVYRIRRQDLQLFLDRAFSHTTTGKGKEVESEAAYFNRLLRSHNPQ